ncbi:isochorismatase family protein [Parasphingorhabdus sp.]|uniref:isochorismatase family protein n=1 Tax=Parasphingorhabdus sp. TaxID=2709688 RepID=UPI002F92D950
MNRPWSNIVTEEEERRYRAAGFGREGGLGKRPALLIIDVQYRTIGTREAPFWESIEEFKTSCGDTGWEAVRHIAPLLERFRERNLPVIYPYVAPKQSFDKGRLAAKVPELMTIAQDGYRFVEEIAPQEDDVLLPKKHPSAFYGTPLASYLIDLGCDGVVVTGCSTSGCVRSSVVDAFSYNFHVTVPEECVYDRSPAAHAVNLFDMAYKYADVKPLADIDAALAMIGGKETS